MPTPCSDSTDLRASAERKCEGNETRNLTLMLRLKKGSLCFKPLCRRISVFSALFICISVSLFFLESCFMYQTGSLPCVLVCKWLSSGPVGSETRPSSVYIAGYGAPYGYSTAAPAYGMYSPIINELEMVPELLWQSKCGSPRRNFNRDSSC